ncbi:MAG: DegT/DnrJ/EryC1/StrS family aminotransferase [Thermodesulfobacteriota bacterium]|nr:DegT/DnrJ/EryC1/StrS family aminotransferase [Thermodesulfobacteriota bacterium]
MGKLERFLTEYFDGQSSYLYARGTTALYALFKRLYSIKGNGEVVIPAICCETVALAVLYAGLRPVIADVDAKTLCISYNSVLEELSDNTVALVLVHIFGNQFDPTPFQKLKDDHDILIVEDIAQAVGGHDRGQRLGRRYDFTLLSFHDTKILKGHGGALIQRNPAYGSFLESSEIPLPPSPPPHILKLKEQSFRNHVHSLFDLSRADPSVDISQVFRSMIAHYKDMFIRDASAFEEDYIINQLQEIDDDQQRRHEKYLLYKKLIENEELQVIDYKPGTTCWRLPILVKDSVNTFHLTALLRRHGILASNHYFPLDKLLFNTFHRNSGDIGSRIINLWVDDTLSIDQIRKTADLLNSYQPIAFEL